VYEGWEGLENLADGLDQHIQNHYQGKYGIARDTAWKHNGVENIKFYSMEGKRHIGRPDSPWLSPFLDLWYVPCSSQTCSKKGEDYDRDIIFPIKNGTFGHLTQPVPNRPEVFLETRYNLTPCTVAVPIEFDHKNEMFRIPQAIEPFRGGVPFQAVARRLSDSICTQRHLDELPFISLARRLGYAAEVNRTPATFLNTEICKELQSIEVDNNISKATFHVSMLAKQGIKVAVFNMQQAVHWKDSLDHLRDAQIIMLTEADDGMARTGNINVARQLALELGKNYVQAIEFVELSNSTTGEENKKGFQCNAILSDYQLDDLSIARLPGIDKWFKPPAQSQTELLLGSRIVLQSKVKVDNQHLHLAVTQLDGSNDQFEATVKAVSQDSASAPMIYAGDHHASMKDVQGHLDVTGLSFQTSRRQRHTPLLAARGLKISNMDTGIQPPTGPGGKLLSDSTIVSFSVYPAGAA
jgi:hypothetical protein